MRAFFLLVSLMSLIIADEIRPAYLEMKEISPTEFSVWFKIPKKGTTRSIDLALGFGKEIKQEGVRKVRNSQNAFIESYHISSSTPLISQAITIKGLRETTTDVLVHISRLDGSTQIIRVVPEAPVFVIGASQELSQVIWTYLKLGVEHILMGYDHLLFVFALVLLVRTLKMLLWTITSFTFAHSITLALASLDVLTPSSRAVEAIIALSIMFVAAEIIYGERGKRFLSQRWPWMIAFVFGLIHGLGFAGALKEVGLPQDEIVASLLFFNVGVELGQLVFVSLLLVLGWVFRSLLLQRTRLYRVGASYLIGSIASVWFLERVL